MSYYEVLLFLHILAVIVWIGGALALQGLGAWGVQTADGPFMQALGNSSEWLAKRLFIPSSLATLIFGILLTIEGPWGFDTLWVSLGLIGFGFSFLTGILFLEPQGKRIARASAAHGPDSREAQLHIRRMYVVQRVELVILVLVIAAMAIKPTSEDGGTLTLFAAVALAGLASAAWSLRSIRSDPAPAG